MTTALYFTSERKMPRNKWGQWNSCRVIASMSAAGIVSGNECFLRRNGRYRGLPGRVNLAMKGLKAPDGYWKSDTGFNQGDVDEMHRAMFSDLPMPMLIGTQNWWDLFTHLPERQDNGSYSSGNIINIAVRLGALPANDPARQYTSADHQVTLRARRKRNGKWQVKVIDPMRPQKANYQGDWVPANSIKKAAKAILDGLIVAELYGDDGEWTDVKLVRRRKNVVIAQQREVLTETNRALARVRDDRDAALADAQRLGQSLEDCVSGNHDETTNDLLDSLHQWEEEQRP